MAPRVGRRAAAAVDTTPAKVMVLAFLSLSPVAVGFILVPLLTGDAQASRTFVPLVLGATPLLALGSLVLFFRASPWARSHRAARIGALLDGTSLLLWLFVLLGVLRG